MAEIVELHPPCLGRGCTCSFHRHHCHGVWQLSRVPRSFQISLPQNNIELFDREPGDQRLPPCHHHPTPVHVQRVSGALDLRQVSVQRVVDHGRALLYRFSVEHLRHRVRSLHRNAPPDVVSREKVGQTGRHLRNLCLAHVRGHLFTTCARMERSVVELQVRSRRKRVPLRPFRDDQLCVVLRLRVLLHPFLHHRVPLRSYFHRVERAHAQDREKIKTIADGEEGVCEGQGHEGENPERP